MVLVPAMLGGKVRARPVGEDMGCVRTPVCKGGQLHSRDTQCPFHVNLGKSRNYFISHVETPVWKVESNGNMVPI